MQGQALQDEDEPFKDLAKEIEELQGKAQESVLLSANKNDILHVDDQIIATATLQTEEEILVELPGEDLEDSQEDDDIIYDEPTSRPTTVEIRNAMEVVSKYCLFSDKGDMLHSSYLKLNDMIEVEFIQN